MIEETSASNSEQLIKQFSDMVTKEYKMLREEGDYYLTDRSFKFNFSKVFKEAVTSYSEEVFLVDRIFKGKAIKDSVRTFYKPSQEQEAIYKEFEAFSQDKQKEEEMDASSYQQVLNDYMERLQQIQPEIVEVPVKVYMMHDEEEIMVHDMKDMPDKFLEVVATHSAGMVIGLFHGCNMIMNMPYRVDIMPIKYDDYIDIIARFSAT